MGQAQSVAPLLPTQIELDKLRDGLGRTDPIAAIDTFKVLAKAYRENGDSLLAGHALSWTAELQLFISQDKQAEATIESARQILPASAHWHTSALTEYVDGIVASKQRRLEAAGRAIDELDRITSSTTDTLWMLRRKKARISLKAILGNYAEALEIFYETEPIALAFNDRNRLVSLYSALAYVHVLRQDFEASWEANKKSFHYSNLDHPVSRIAWYSGRSNYALHLGKLDRVLSIIDSAIAYADQIGMDEIEIYYMARRGDVYRYQEYYPKAIESYTLAEKAKREKGLDASELMYLIGICYRGLDRYDLAGPQMEAAFAEAKGRNLMKRAERIAHGAYQTYLWRDKHEQALKWFEKHVNIRDSIRTSEQLLDEEVILAKLEARNNEVALQQANIDALKARSKSRLLMIILASLVGLTMLGYYTFRQRQRLQKLQLFEAQRRERQLDRSLHEKNALLNVQALTLTQKNALLNSLQEEITQASASQQSSDIDRKVLSKLTRSIANDVTESQDWEVFTSTIEEIRSSFFRELIQRHPKLSTNDKRLVSLLRLNMSSKEIARTLNISDAGVKKARYRLRKKLALESGTKVDIYLQEIEEAAQKKKAAKS